MTLLDPVDVKKSKGRKNNKSIPSGIPLPPDLRPPTRPQGRLTSFNPSGRGQDKGMEPESPVREASLPSYATHPPNTSTPLPKYTSTVDSPTELDPISPQGEEAGSVVVKVHYRYTVALSVPLGTPYDELQERIAHKLGQPASHLRLRHRQHGSQALKPLDGEEGLRALLAEVEAGRTTLWCQTEDPLANRTILYHGWHCMTMQQRAQRTWSSVRETLLTFLVKSTRSGWRDTVLSCKSK
ncbi:hypothetical protein J4Q44_G00168270 [Coregonus suidteri]|uniref:Uncharacterized protein n=1 Tax=Coregonus suidteri TaxID=861788 RepID=A0AAN8LW52_9TELE